MVARWASTIRRDDVRRQPGGRRSSPPRWRGGSRPGAPCGPRRRRRSRRPARRGPSSSSRSAPRWPRPRPGPSSRGAAGPPRRPPPGPRCRRCSSGSRPRRPGARSRRTKVSPRQALRRWPMWAALLGLMLVCSTITWPRLRCGAAWRGSRAAPGRRRPGRGRGSRSPRRRPRHAPRPGAAASLSASSTGDVSRLAPQRLRQIEGRGEGEVPQLDPGGVLEGDRLEGDVEGGPRGISNRAGKALLRIQDHNL